MNSAKSIKYLKFYFIQLIQAILYYPGFYSSLSDKKQRNAKISKMKLEFGEN